MTALTASLDLESDEELLESVTRTLIMQQSTEIAKVEQVFGGVSASFYFATTADDPSAAAAEQVRRAAQSLSIDVDLANLSVQYNIQGCIKQPMSPPTKPRSSRVLPTTPGAQGRCVILSMTDPKPGSKKKPHIVPTKIQDPHHNSIINVT